MSLTGIFTRKEKGISFTRMEQPYFDCQGKLILSYDGSLYNAGELKRKLTAKHNFMTEMQGEVVIHLLEESYRGDLASDIKAIVGLLDGDYAMAVTDGEEMILLRDPVGTKPLYYASQPGYIAFASEKKALWRAGFGEVKPLRAGMMAKFGSRGLEICRAFPLSEMDIKVRIKELSPAIEGYNKALYSAVRKRLGDTDRVGVLVSGGVDSCLIAKLVSEIAAEEGIEVIAYSSGSADSSDLGYAEDFTRSIGLKHKANRLDLSKVEAYLPRVIQAVEERDFIQIEAGIGIYAAMEIASRDGIRVIFSGQGPDELWGGYTWYPKVVEEEGYAGLLKREWEDLGRADIETLDRENKIAISLGMEVRFPYLDLEVVKLAMSVSPELKISSAEDDLGKRPHRELAKRLGVPPRFADRTKEAAQHGTGVHQMLDELARRNGFTSELVEGIGYTPEEITTEKLGSSARYGYRYSEDRSLWLVPAHIQLFLDVMAYRGGMLNERERRRIERFVDRI